jgi:uncharacterized protein YndB with AHSA1/START domain
MLVKTLKWILALIVLLAAVLLVGGLLLSPKFSVTRSEQIAAPPERVYGLVASPRAWKQWSGWNQRDPHMQMNYSGAETGAGAVWEWKSASQGDGRMRFTAAEPPQRLAYELYFPDFGTTSTGELRFAAKDGGTLVSWSMNGDMGSNPLYRWFALFADSTVGTDFAAGLANLKALAEQP